MKPIIEIKNLSAGYDGRTVLHDVNLSIYERDFLGIIGPNGGGKTTLIKCILGLLKPTGGEIIFHTPEKASTKTTSTFLGYLPQYNSIDRKFPISVEEVILSGLSIQKSLTSRFTPEQKEKGKQIISRMGLEGLEHRSIGQLSGGQLQRALLGRAIISDPAVLILDEPSTYIDKRFEARLYELLAEINKECAIILVSHDIGSQKLSEVEIDMKLKEYFADHDVLIRSDFQALCGMARTTANVHLKRLQQEGKLKNVGKPTQPIYRAMPGYYGVSRDAKAGR